MLLSSDQADEINEALSDLHREADPKGIPALQRFLDDVVEILELAAREDMVQQVREEMRSCPWCNET